ncbi:MAG: NAD(P)/FAD-dependent oxidoreductase [Candidatus Adiutrix sp.]|jgi:glycerol-3-phosphate dehydrogenase|nr:NAD(P)/FAD-dependent oxidoreductase [Candidatus Adiutrix sp.]
MKIFEVLIIGAGVVGAALARDLVRHPLSVALLEAGPEPGEGASKGNSALMCTGWDTPRGSLEREMVRRGYERYLNEAPLLGLPIRRTGSTMIAWNEEQAETLKAEREAAREDAFAVEWLDRAALYQREPKLGSGALAALFIPGESVVDPFSTVHAYLLEAFVNGAVFLPGRRVVRCARRGNLWEVEAETGELFRARFVVNCAGLGGDRVDAAAGFHDFVIKPRKGQFVLFDKLAAPLVNSILAPTPGPAGRGVLVVPTIFGNVMLGPTAEEVDDPEDRAVTRAGLDFLLSGGRRLLPDLEKFPLVTTHAGMRPASDKSEYRFIPRTEQGWISVGGIRSTGLSSALGLAEHVTSILAKSLEAGPARDIRRVRVPDLSAGRVPAWEDPSGPEDGEIVCHCEKITLGEIRRALASPLPPVTLGGLRRRTRAGYGRCQGFFCGARLAELLREQGGGKN